jgi:inosine-uridine nucleoside N-ribohydrolase
MNTKVLLDTDIGSDIDDAVCLAYLLAKPECDLLGITTVSGESEKRAQIASALCRVAGQSIPIYPGRDKPLLRAQKQTTANQAAALDRWPHETKFPKGEAVDFLRRTIRDNPGEVVLLAIGPMTNIAALAAADAEAFGMLKALVLMCGVFTNKLPGVGPLEWNALLDPHASAITYTTPAPVHRSIGLDVTTQVRLSADEIRKRFTAPLLQPVRDFAEVWFKHADSLIFHDPLAGATIFNDNICAYERGNVDVELLSDNLCGYTRWTPNAEGAHEIATSVDADRFLCEYFSVFES